MVRLILRFARSRSRSLTRPRNSKPCRKITRSALTFRRIAKEPIYGDEESKGNSRLHADRTGGSHGYRPDRAGFGSELVQPGVAGQLPGYAACRNAAERTRRS